MDFEEYLGAEPLVFEFLEHFSGLDGVHFQEDLTSTAAVGMVEVTISSWLVSKCCVGQNQGT